MTEAQPARPPRMRIAITHPTCWPYVRRGSERVLNDCAVWLAGRGHDVSGLIFTISADNLSAGIASCAFIAYLSGLTNAAYSATQYALFSSFMALPGKLLAGGSGWIVEAIGFPLFFVYTAAMGLPAVALALILLRRQRAVPTPR